MATAPSTTVLKAFRVLDLLRDRRQVGVAECARLLGLARPSAHRLLVSLTAAGALERTESGQYQLALRMFELGAQAPFRRSLYDQAHAPLQELVSATHLPADLGVRDQTEVLHLLKISHDAERAHTRAGGRNRLYATAMGKMLLADAPVRVIEQVLTGQLHPYTPYTVTAPAQLAAQVEMVRRSGFAYEMEERQIGLVGLATAIHDRDGRVLAAISVSGRSERYRPRIETLRQPLRRAADAIERNIRSLPRSVVART
ncbi:MAG: IclR family transcriptional regulator [Euzebyales bacterium]|nr:IclR family transcriptional regulator [Euzebyales bacterium]